jgi:two-component system chemotaxis sensor kinase CheA
MNNVLAQDPELLKDFLAECEELLQRADQDLVALEASGANGSSEYTDLVNRIFRVFHTIKGTSGFMGLDQIVDLTHHAEDVLNILRQRTTPPAQATMRETMDVLLAALDQLARMIAAVREGAPPVSAPEHLIRKIVALRDELEQESDQESPGQERPRLGEIMVVEQVISRTELNESLAEAAWDGRKLGEVLVDKKLASAAQVEEALGRQASKPKETAQTIRVDTTKLDDLLNLVGELVLERNRLVRLNTGLRNGEFNSEQFNERFAEALSESSSRLSSITEELQSASLRTRMVPIDAAFRRFPRLVRDIARALGKEVELIVNGEDTELDKNVVEQIGDPLLHLMRNALDHGIESPAKREAAGKPRKGCIFLEAQQEGDHIVVSVTDDGAGMDPQKLGRKALDKGLITPERLALMSEQEMLNLIFLPGFSTAEKITDLSGRGVGMDVVRANLERINGVVELESVAGEGSLVRLKLPLTLAIMPVLLVGVSGETYALPLRSVQEIVSIPRTETHKVGGVEVFRLRDRVIPLQYLSRMFQATGNAEPKANLTIVVLGSAEKRTGIVVETLLGQEETVVKPLGPYLGHVRGVSGATISGDGRVRLILDPAALTEEATV